VPQERERSLHVNLNVFIVHFFAMCQISLRYLLHFMPIFLNLFIDRFMKEFSEHK